VNSLFDKLNLRPQERRLVIIVAIVVFVVLNFWLVIPMFGDYGKYQQRISDSEKKVKGYQDEINKRDAYQKELNELKTQGGYVPTEEAALRLSQEINSQAALSGVTLTSISPLQRQASGGKTNAFFDEAAVTVNVNTGEKELIDFLFRLADKETLIRAKTMNISTDPTRMRLQGPITLVKSFQRRPPPKVTAAVSATPKPTPAATSAPQKSEPPVKPPSKPATPAVTPTAPKATSAPPATLPTTAPATNRVRRMPAPVKP
jgi:Tfp pilus assembly protein PilO